MRNLLIYGLAILGIVSKRRSLMSITCRKAAVYIGHKSGYYSIVCKDKKLKIKKYFTMLRIESI